MCTSIVASRHMLWLYLVKSLTNTHVSTSCNTPPPLSPSPPPLSSGRYGLLEISVEQGGSASIRGKVVTHSNRAGLGLHPDSSEIRLVRLHTSTHVFYTHLHTASLYVYTRLHTSSLHVYSTRLLMTYVRMVC
jgi:hypothetical protein